MLAAGTGSRAHSQAAGSLKYTTSSCAFANSTTTVRALALGMQVVACSEESAHIVVISNSCACQVNMKAPLILTLINPSPRAHTFSLVVAYDKRVNSKVLRRSGFSETGSAMFLVVLYLGPLVRVKNKLVWVRRAV